MHAVHCNACNVRAMYYIYTHSHICTACNVMRAMYCV